MVAAKVACSVCACTAIAFSNVNYTSFSALLSKAQNPIRSDTLLREQILTYYKGNGGQIVMILALWAGRYDTAFTISESKGPEFFIELLT